MMRSQEKIPIFKLVVVGEEGSGKTNLVSRLTKDVFTGGNASTMGAAFHTHVIRIIKNEEVIETRSDIWDTGGNARLQDFLKIYYRTAHVVMIVVDLSQPDGLSKVGSYKETYHNALADYGPIILVGNKSDLERKITDEQIAAKAKELNCPYFIASAKTGKNVPEAFIKAVSLAWDFQEEKSKKDKKVQIGVVETEDRRNAVLEALNAYKDLVEKKKSEYKEKYKEKHSLQGLPKNKSYKKYSYDLTFFPNRRGKNRQLNYKWTINVIEKIESGETLSELSTPEKIKALRGGGKIRSPILKNIIAAMRDPKVKLKEVPKFEPKRKANKKF